MLAGNVTLLEAVQFLVKPLDCNADSPQHRVLSAAIRSVAAEPGPWGPLAEATWRASCSLHIRPAVPLATALAACVFIFLLLRNALVRFLRWYAAARGSQFVAVATAALRELHASTSALALGPPAAGAGAAAGAGSHSPVAHLRPAAAHRWYTPQAITAPVVCCACFQPVVAPEGAEGYAQCCELCGMVAHGRCSKAVPHNCRLLAVPPGAAALAGGEPQEGGGDGGVGDGAAAAPARLSHDWRPAGTTLDLILPPADTELLLLGTDDTGAGGQPGRTSAGCTSHGPSSLCLYCGEPCEVGLLAVEPVWRCGACRRFAHVQCWSSLHAGVLSAATQAALEGQALEAEEMVPGSPRAGASPRWAQQLARPGTAPATARAVPPSGTGPGPASRRSNALAAAVPSPALDPRVQGSGAGLWNGQRRSQSLPNIAGYGIGGVGARGSGGGSGPQQAGRQPWGHGGGGGGTGGAVTANGDGGGAGGGGGSAASLAASYPGGPGEPRVDWALLRRLDRCDPQATLGVLGAMVLPPTAVVPAAAGARTTPANPPAPEPVAAPQPADEQAAAGGTASPTAPVAPAAVGGAAASAVAAGSAGGRARKKQLDRALRQAQKWYRSRASWALTAAATADPSGPDRWRHFRVEPRHLPPGCRPLLVFINPRSGPQAGEQLRRQLLQLLHPMQLVDLLREAPAAALRCWWGVPGLRVLVIGGDGTAGWILGEMDKLAAEVAAAAAGGGEAPGGPGGATGGGADRRQPPLLPAPPPVAVLPLGTGNDLARVLGWGGGLAALDARGGVAAVLGEVAVAAPTQLDRWALAVTPTPPDPPMRGRSFLPRRRKPAEGLVPRSLPPPSEVKLFNNYLGVGIDSWCALEFHRMRERYPGWFRSQLGNKMWYTGVGARDLLARSCVDLPTRMQLLCDGCVVELPPSAQGILLLSIPSYMGGVDLWGNGVSLQQQQQQQQQLLLPAHPPQVPGQGQPNGTAGGGGGGGKAGEHLHSPERPVPQPPLSYRGQPQQPQHPAMPPQRPTAAATAGTTPSPVAAPGAMASRRGGGSGGGSPTSATTSTAASAGVGSAVAAAGPGPGGGGGGGGGSGGAVGSGPAGGIGGTSGLSAPGGPHHHQHHPSVPQSMSDGVLEVVAVYGAVHLGQLQVGLARATRLCQCRTAVITTLQALPMQADGEPWMQPAAQLVVSLKGSATMLRRLDLSSAASRLTAAVGEVLDGAVAAGTITAAQRHTLGAELARKLGAPHAV